ncbi:PKD domain-containing protein [Arthrobacter sp. zg-Y1110]|uniref:PKD domain-containing protein n=1 Tax=Arthrobacter sp. zg-Y1110 TaxID=2886932 RepID=UPI001E53FC52|nr:PKD domain-containing protein [Arthrobacter sp. zg-Y1110]UWX86807.1 PKD domain-containing protein [Arthrobacter sp. zg-Y1110]
MVFVIDSTGSMGEDIDAAKETVANMSAWVEKMRGRVALVEYRDEGDEFTARVLSGLQDNTVDLKLKLEAVTVDGGGDEPEALLHGLMTALNGLEWRDGATKAAVVLTDAGFHSPDMVDGTTLDQVARRALEIDPVNVYPVVDSWNAEEYAELAAATTGQVIINEGDTAAALEEALSRIETRPVALLPLVDYYIPAGGTVTFDASKSHSNGDATITAYDWDFDGDGTFDSSTATPVQTHIYTDAADEVMQVRVTDSNGQVANMSAFVHVGTVIPGSDLPAAPTVTGTDAEDGTIATLSWTPGDALADTWAVTVNGTPIARMEGAARTVTVTDLERDEPVVLGVAGISADGSIGDYGTVELPAVAAEPTPVPTPTETSDPTPSDTPSVDPSPSDTPSTGPSPSSDPSETTPGEPSPGADATPSPTVLPAGDTKTPTSGESGGFLASTGARITGVLLLGAGSLAAGIALVAARRRRTAE